jgi:copper chaperone CopZ
MHAAQNRQQIGGMSTSPDLNTTSVINVKGKCIPGKIDLPGLADAVNRHASRLAHRGGHLSDIDVTSSLSSAVQYGDPNTTPVVYESCDGVLQIVLTVDGITCAHCVKIVETVLRGCNNSKSPISGLLDAAADRDLSSVIIRIDNACNAKRIAFEAARNLSMVGYKAKPNEISISGEEMGTESVNKLFSNLAKVDPFNFFDWTAPCSCPDSGVYRSDCAR